MTTSSKPPHSFFVTMTENIFQNTASSYKCNFFLGDRVKLWSEEHVG